MEKNTVAVTARVLRDEMKFEDTTVLTYRIEYPEMKSSICQMCVAVVNKFYRTRAFAYQEHVKNELYPLAVEQYKEAVANGDPVRVFEALVTFKVTYNHPCIVSLYMDTYEYTGGAHGLTARTSDTWNLQKCRRIDLGELFGCGLDYKEYIFRHVIQQIEQEPDIYFEDYERLVRETFNENSFYCTPRGIVVYYQQYDIAPYASGIREFLIPYTKCVFDPKKTCFAR